MRRVLVLAACALLVFSSAISETVTLSSFPESGAEEAVLPIQYADELEKRFGIPILIGAECLNQSENPDFSVGLSPWEGASAFLKSLTGELEMVERALSQYPEGTLEKLRTKNLPNGVRIFIPSRAVLNNPEGIFSAYTIGENDWFNVYLVHGLFIETSVHHELWHVIEDVIREKSPGAFLIWDVLNPAGFQYSSDYTHATGDFDPEYFAREYGTVSPLEDSV